MISKNASTSLLWIFLFVLLHASSLTPTALAQMSAPAAMQAPESGDPNEIVLTVGGERITAGQFEKMLTALPPQFAALLNTMGKKGFAEQYANLLSLYLEGQKRNVEQSEQFRQMMEFDRKVLLAQATMNEIVLQADDISTEEIYYYYQSHQDEFEQRKVRGIYLPFATEAGQNNSDPGFNIADLKNRPYTEQEAQRKALQLRAYINAGSDMAEMAKTESKHGTASQGGDFGYIGRADMKPALATAIFNLQPRRVSGPVRDEKGFYIFLVEEKRVRPLEELEAGIRRILSTEKLSLRLEQVKKDFPVALDQEYFAAEADPAAGSPE